MTWRELQHMTDGRQEAEWARTAALLLGQHKTMTGQGPKLIELIPARYWAEDSPISAEQDEAMADLTFAEMESGLKAFCRKEE